MVPVVEMKKPVSFFHERAIPNIFGEWVQRSGFRSNKKSLLVQLSDKLFQLFCGIYNRVIFFDIRDGFIFLDDSGLLSAAVWPRPAVKSSKEAFAEGVKLKFSENVFTFSSSRLNSRSLKLTSWGHPR